MPRPKQVDVEQIDWNSAPGDQLLAGPEGTEARSLTTVSSRALGGVVDATTAAERRRASQGRGVSLDQRDRILPFLSLLQKTAPQVERGGELYVEGAEPGDFLLKNHPKPIVRGDEGFLFQLCRTDHVWVEWRPRSRGGGIAGRHAPVYRPHTNDTQPAEAYKGPHPDWPNQREAWLIGDEGNFLVDTRYLIGNVILDTNPRPYLEGSEDPGAARRAQPVFIPLISTGHAVFRRLNTQLSMQRGEDGNTIDAFDRLFRFTSRRRSKGPNSWYEIDFSDQGRVSDQLWDIGAQLYELSVSGARVAQEEDQAGSVVAHDPETGEIRQGRKQETLPDDDLPF